MRRETLFAVCCGSTLFFAGCLDQPSSSPVASPDVPDALKEEESVPEFASKMLTSYGELMNDLALIDNGMLGTSRMGPVDAAFAHTSASKGRAPRSVLPTQQALYDLRKGAQESGTHFGDGLISVFASPGVVTTRGPKTVGSISYWWGTTGSPGPAFNIKNEQEIRKVGADAVEAVKSAPDKVYERAIDGGKFYARAIRYEKPRCLSCHKDAKLNDVAGVAAVVIARHPSDMKPGNMGTVLPPPTSPEGMGIASYPGATIDSGFVDYRRHERFDQLRMAMQTPDSAEKVIQYYSEQLKSKPDLRISTPDKNSVRYEFGNEFFGVILARQKGKTTSITYAVGRQTDLKP